MLNKFIYFIESDPNRKAIWEAFYFFIAYDIPDGFKWIKRKIIGD